ncbi:MAG: FtsK/SpoIIIE domain-containing protein [Gammaproteobacteria bacterium]|nr:FtsK/SpoIIIE domain-containing protein [Gammaproteobacteria bacterium]
MISNTFSPDRQKEEQRKILITNRYISMASYLTERGIQAGIHYDPSFVHNFRIGALQLNGLHPDKMEVISKASMRNKLEYAAQLGANEHIRIVRDRGAVLISFSLPQYLWEAVPINSIGHSRLLNQTIGWTVKRKPIRVNFKKPLETHALIAGSTGSGKTNMMMVLAYGLCTYNETSDVRIVIIDIEKKGQDWHKFKDADHLLSPIATTLEEARTSLRIVNSELNKRISQNYNVPEIFVFVDELAEIMEDTFSQNIIGRIAQMGRSYGIHLALGTQRVVKRILSHPNLENNVTLRLCGKVNSANEAFLATKVAQTGADKLTGGSGEFILKTSQELVHIAAPLVTETDLATLPKGQSPVIIPESHKAKAPSVTYDASAIEPELLSRILTAKQAPTRSDFIRHFRVGQSRARYLLAYRTEFLKKLREQGYEITPIA